MNIRFNNPYTTGNEIRYIEQAIAASRLAGDGMFTRKCERLLEERLGCDRALLTHSCTAALEIAAMMIGIGPEDEVIMPSYTFVSTANAFVLRGGVPVFVDVRSDTLNIDESKIEQAITKRTKAICVVHYAGVSCEMDEIMNIARKHGLVVIEDAAQALGSKYKNEQLGTIGDLATFSFHETKNIQSGEGGALIINNKCFSEKAEIIREKGTDRSQYFRGEIDKYTWVDIGSSYLPSELVSAYLYAQLEKIEFINNKRLKVCFDYKNALSSINSSDLKFQEVPLECTQNGHMFYLLLKDSNQQKRFLSYLKKKNIGAVFHYIPLHMSKAGKKYSKTPFPLTVTENIYDRIVRLPLWPDLSTDQLTYISENISSFFEN